MPKVVLPTAEILKTFKDFEHLFDFYEDGLKGVVRDMVFTADTFQAQPDRVRDAFKQALQNSGLIEKIMRDYSMSPEAQFHFHVGSHTQESAVEIAAQCIYVVVLQTMSNLFMRAVYEISKQEWDWVGQDLIASVQVLDNGSGDNDS
jgi:hypothetical protein